MNTPLQPIHLRCEYEINPLGIDEVVPRLSWQLSDPRRGARQSAYEVNVASTLALLDSEPDVWNSAKIVSDQSVQVEYRGKPLQSRQRCWWKVRVWDAGGQPSPWSEPAWWEMAFTRREDWTAKWIGSRIVGGPYSIPP